MFLLILFVATISKPLNPKKVLYAINCGAPSSFKSQSGIQYEKDIQTDPETVVADYSLNSEVSSQQIKYTRESDIYLTERHAYKTFNYQIPLQKEGTHTLILKFAEMYFDKPGKRVFHIKFGDQRVIENLDVVSKVGKYASNDEYIEFEYVAGQVFFNNSLCINAVKEGKLQLFLEKTKHDNPYIHGIVLYQGAINETDYSEYQYMKNNWEKVVQDDKVKEETERQKKSEAKVKRKERVKIRNDHLNDMENEFEVDDQEKQVEQQQLPKTSLKQLITGPLGIAGLWVSFIIGITILKKLFTIIDTQQDQVEQQDSEKDVQKQLKQQSGKKQQKVKK